MSKLTKQGVRDLNSGTSNRHVHRYLPTTHTARNGYQTTRMVCWCGDAHDESIQEKRQREALKADAACERADAATLARNGW